MWSPSSVPAERSPWPGLLGLGAPWLDSLDSRSIPGGRRRETQIASCSAWRVLLTHVLSSGQSVFLTTLFHAQLSGRHCLFSLRQFPRPKKVDWA